MVKNRIFSFNDAYTDETINALYILLRNAGFEIDGDLVYATDSQADLLKILFPDELEELIESEDNYI